MESTTKQGSMSNRLKVLIVEDSVNDTFFVVRELQRGGFQVGFERVETQAAMQAALDAERWDLVISDYSMPQFNGTAALMLFQQRAADIPFIIVSGAIGEDRAIELLKAGAHDCVMKDNLTRLVPAVRRELEAAQQRRLTRQTETVAAFLASLVRSCEEAIVGKTLAGTVVSWNAAAERLYGYSAVEMVGHSISKLYPRAQYEELSQLLERVGQGDRVKDFHTVRLHKNGTPLEVALTLSPVRDRSGTIIGASTIVREIPQNCPRRRVQAEEQAAGLSGVNA
jgi:PAS domain S-box-containing protein